MKHILLLLAMVFSMSLVMDVQFVEARSSSYRSHKSSSKAKTVHVRSYTKKNGTVVRSHMRSAPSR